MFFVYLLQSRVTKKWYIGFTENVSQRLEQHNAGKNISTTVGRPWDVIYYETYLNKLDALGREKFLKSGSGHRFLKKQLTHFLNFQK